MTEAQHQANVIKWTQQPSIRDKWPELALLHHIPNERQCTPIQGRQLKLCGLRPGVPDLHLPVARGGFHSLYIELKGNKGRLSDAQKWWIDQLAKQGNYACVCYGWESAVKILENYLSLEA